MSQSEFQQVKVVVSASNQIFEFVGDIKDIDDKYFIINTKNSTVLIEQKNIVFISIDTDVEKAVQQTRAKYFSQKLKHDPIEQMLREKIVPPSQIQDDEEDEFIDEADNTEVMRNVYKSFSANNTAATANNMPLSKAIKETMSNTNQEHERYNNHLRTMFGLKK